MAKEILVSYGVDIDAVAGWLGSYGGEKSPNDISRGVFAGKVGVPRLLKLFEKYGIKATWFIPGHSLESFPDECRAIMDAGHEVGLHGYSHENPIALSREQEAYILDYTMEKTSEMWGKRPRGYVAPWWEVGPQTVELLLERGIEYDHSMMHKDYEPYYLPEWMKWTPIDYDKPAAEWMKPYEEGPPSKLIEIPASWWLDDLPPMLFMKASFTSHGFVNPRDIGQMWQDQFDWVYREYDYAVFPMTIHPDTSGKPQALMMHERLIGHVLRHPGARFVTMGEIADSFKERSSGK